MSKEQITGIVLKGHCAKCGGYGELIGGVGGWFIGKIKDFENGSIYISTIKPEHKKSAQEVADKLNGKRRIQHLLK